MDHSSMTTSQEIIIPTQSGKLLPQFVAVICATIGSLAMGSVLGWSAPAGIRLKNNEYGFLVTQEDMSWIGSLAFLGAACICYPIGFFLNKIGRKASMMVMVLPFTVGWVLIIIATNTTMLYIGRFFTGLGGGAFVVTIPIYVSEIAEDRVRGILGVFIQFMLTIGVLISYSIGGYANVMTLSIISAVIPLIFGVLFFFMPETPYYLMTKGRRREAKESIIWLRGSDHYIDAELDKIKEALDKAKSNRISFRNQFSNTASFKALIICLALMVLVQFSGINILLLNVQDMFDHSTLGLTPVLTLIIIGGTQAICTALAIIEVDREKKGRRILLITSSVMVSVCLVGLGVYFYIRSSGADEETLKNLLWLPLICVFDFIVGFSLGLGPIPFVICSDVCTHNIRTFVISTAGTLNWILGFVVTRTFMSIMNDDLSIAIIFWVFAAISFVGIWFIVIVIPETKRKSIEEIQVLLTRPRRLCC